MELIDLPWNRHNLFNKKTFTVSDAVHSEIRHEGVPAHSGHSAHAMVVLLHYEAVHIQISTFLQICTQDHTIYNRMISEHVEKKKGEFFWTRSILCITVNYL